MTSCPHCGGQLARLDIGAPAAVQWFCSQCLRLSEPAGPLAGLRETLNVLEYKPVFVPKGLTIEAKLFEEMGSVMTEAMSRLESGIFTHTLTPKPRGGLFHTSGAASSEPMKNPPYISELVAWDIEFGNTDMGIDLEQPQKDEVPVIEGSVIGFRAWHLNGRTWRLQGTGKSHGGEDWVPGVNEAHCGPREYNSPNSMEFLLRLFDKHPWPPHKAPGANCHCGLNGLARFQDEASWYKIADINNWRHVVGAFEAWSDESKDQRFFIHSTGFRAQYGQIVLLAVEDDCSRSQRSAVKALAADYGADMCKLSHLEDAAKEHGQLVPDHMLVWAAEQEARRRIPEIFGPPIMFGFTAEANNAKQAAARFHASAKKLQETMGHSQLSMERAAHNLSELGKALNKPPSRPHKGIKQRLKTPGPPFHGRWKKGDVVQDCKQRLFECVAAGSPGSWSPIAG